MTSPIGTSIKRREDERLVTGRGRYLDDLRLPGILHAAIVRSPYAHARVARIDGAPARALPGVIAVLTGADIPECTGSAVPPLVPSTSIRPYRHPAAALYHRLLSPICPIPAQPVPQQPKIGAKYSIRFTSC